MKGKVWWEWVWEKLQRQVGVRKASCCMQGPQRKDSSGCQRYGFSSVQSPGRVLQARAKERSRNKLHQEGHVPNTQGQQQCGWGSRLTVRWSQSYSINPDG